MSRSANHKTAENDATVTLLLYKEHSMHIDVYEAIQLTVIVLFSILRCFGETSSGPQTLEKRSTGLSLELKIFLGRANRERDSGTGNETEGL